MSQTLEFVDAVSLLRARRVGLVKRIACDTVLGATAAALTWSGVNMIGMGHPDQVHAGWWMLGGAAGTLLLGALLWDWTKEG